MTRIAVVDNHGQFTHLEQRALRDMGVDVETIDNETPPEEVDADGLVFSGGPDMDRIGNCPDYLDLDIPVFGICLGMQMMVVEYARNVCDLAEATSSEFDEDTEHPIIYKLRDLLGVEEMGGTMRLGAYPCRLVPGTKAREIYGGADEISERHRHRYEVNQKYLDVLTGGGLRMAGMSPDGKFVEMVELPDHPWYVGCQFHPEYRSRPHDPHPLFVSFIGAALEERRRRAEPERAREREAVPLAEAG